MDQQQNPPEKSQKVPCPYWIPPGVVYDDLPENLRLALEQVINPAYEDLVLKPAKELDRAFGLTLVHILWIEVLQQRELAAKMLRMVATSNSTETHQETIGRHLRLISAKINIGKFLIRLREYLENQDRFPLDRLRNQKGMQ